MEKKRDFFTPYVIIVDDDDVKNFDDHLSMLRQDAEWGGAPEIIAQSGFFDCFLEVYKFTETQNVHHFPNEPVWGGGPDPQPKITKNGNQLIHYRRYNCQSKYRAFLSGGPIHEINRARYLII